MIAPSDPPDIFGAQPGDDIVIRGSGNDRIRAWGAWTASSPTAAATGRGPATAATRSSAAGGPLFADAGGDVLPGDLGADRIW